MYVVSTVSYIIFKGLISKGPEKVERESSGGVYRELTKEKMNPVGTNKQDSDYKNRKTFKYDLQELEFTNGINTCPFEQKYILTTTQAQQTTLCFPLNEKVIKLTINLQNTIKFYISNLEKKTFVQKIVYRNDFVNKPLLC